MEIESYKAYSHKINDVTEKGEVDIYVNAYGNLDHDEDISAPGSFTKTAKERFHKIKHLVNHRKDDINYLAGAPKEIITDDPHGLRVISQMNLQKQSIRDVYSDYKLFAEMERSLDHSIGYKAIKRSDSDKRVITEYRLGEYSTLTFLGANPETPLVGLKSQQDVLSQIELLNLALKHGEYTDEKFYRIEAAVKALSNTLQSLMEPPKHSEPTLAELFRQSTAKVNTIKI